MQPSEKRRRAAELEKRTEILRLARQTPYLTYREIAKLIPCSAATVATTCKRAGLKRGQGAHSWVDHNIILMIAEENPRIRYSEIDVIMGTPSGYCGNVCRRYGYYRNANHCFIRSSPSSTPKK